MEDSALLKNAVFPSLCPPTKQSTTQSDNLRICLSLVKEIYLIYEFRHIQYMVYGS